MGKVPPPDNPGIANQPQIDSGGADLGRRLIERLGLRAHLKPFLAL